MKTPLRIAIPALALLGLTLSAQDYQLTNLGTPDTAFVQLSAQLNNRGTLAVGAALEVPDWVQESWEFNPDRAFVYRSGGYVAIPNPFVPEEPDFPVKGHTATAINDHDLVVGHFIWGADSEESFLFDAKDSAFSLLPLGGVWIYEFSNSGYLLGGRIADVDFPVLHNVHTGHTIELNDEFGPDAYTTLVQMNNFDLVHGHELDVFRSDFLYQVGAADPITFGEFDGVLTDLGTFVEVPDGALPGDIASNRFEEHGDLNANDWGLIVGGYKTATGTRAFLYDGTTAHDLNMLIPPADAANWLLERATDINDLGQIVGSMRNAEGDVRLFLLSPSDIAVSDGEWDAAAFASQSGTFTFTYDAVPMADNLDGVTGLSLTAAEAYTDFAVIVRFNTNGRVDARRGNYYRAENTLNYKPGVPYRIELTINLATHRYSAVVTPAGGSPVVIAQDYGFRTEMAQATHLDTLNVLSTEGAVSVGNTTLSPATSAPLFSNNGQWDNATLPTQTGTFTVRFKATPGSRPINGAIGLSRNAADDINDLATTLRFNTSGRVDARNGSRYGSFRSFRYDAGETYDVVMTVNVSTHRYSATIAAPGRTPVTIANNYAFRGSQSAVSQLDAINVRSTGGSLTVQDIVVE